MANILEKSDSEEHFRNIHQPFEVILALALQCLCMPPKVIQMLLYNPGFHTKNHLQVGRGALHAGSAHIV